MTPDSRDLLDHDDHVDQAPAGSPGAGSSGAGSSSTSADHFMRRLLRLPVDGPKATAADARRAFQTSLMVATVRCLLMYIVFPFVLPAVGLSAGVGPLIGLPISAVAIAAIVMSIRRFWRADHSKRWHYTVLGTTVIGFLVVLVVLDLAELLT